MPSSEPKPSRISEFIRQTRHLYLLWQRSTLSELVLTSGITHRLKETHATRIAAFAPSFGIICIDRSI